MKILVTGEAGFTGLHLVDALADKHEVVVLDSLEPQVHVKKPDYPNENATYTFGDVRTREVLKENFRRCRSSLKEPKVGLEEGLRRMTEWFEVMLQ